MNWFTSDPHFDHGNVIKFCDRPFVRYKGALVRPSDVLGVGYDRHDRSVTGVLDVDVDAMNRTMIERWNERVGPRDTVFHLGDFLMKGHKSRIPEIRKKLNGRIILVRGNHDKSKSFMSESGFDEVHENLLMDLSVHEEAKLLKIYMSHIPLTVAPEDGELREKYDKALTKKPPPYYDYFLCGHVHEAWKRKEKVINVGVDVWDFRPVTLQELIEGS